MRRAQPCMCDYVLRQNCLIDNHQYSNSTRWPNRKCVDDKQLTVGINAIISTAWILAMCDVLPTIMAIVYLGVNDNNMLIGCVLLAIRNVCVANAIQYCLCLIHRIIEQSESSEYSIKINYENIPKQWKNQQTGTHRSVAKEDERTDFQRNTTTTTTTKSTVADEGSRKKEASNGRIKSHACWYGACKYLCLCVCVSWPHQHSMHFAYMRCVYRFCITEMQKKSRWWKSCSTFFFWVVVSFLENVLCCFNVCAHIRTRDSVFFLFATISSDVEVLTFSWSLFYFPRCFCRFWLRPSLLLLFLRLPFQSIHIFSHHLWSFFFYIVAAVLHWLGMLWTMLSHWDGANSPMMSARWMKKKMLWLCGDRYTILPVPNKQNACICAAHICNSHSYSISSNRNRNMKWN